MKKICFIVLLLLNAIAIGQQTRPKGTKYADSRVLFREAMAAGASLVATMESNDLEVVKIDMDLVGAGSSKQTLKKLSEGYTYVISAVGQPSRIVDLDIEVYYINDDGSTTEVKKDLAVDNTPTVSFSPYTSGTYMIVIKAAKMVSGFENAMGFYFLVVAHN